MLLFVMCKLGTMKFAINSKQHQRVCHKDVTKSDSHLCSHDQIDEQHPRMTVKAFDIRTNIYYNDLVYNLGCAIFLASHH